MCVCVCVCVCVRACVRAKHTFHMDVRWNFLFVIVMYTFLADSKYAFHIDVNKIHISCGRKVHILSWTQGTYFNVNGKYTFHMNVRYIFLWTYTFFVDMKYTFLMDVKYTFLL